VRVGVHEPRHDGAASKIHEARVVAGEPAEICTDADFRDAVRGDREASATWREGSRVTTCPP